MKLTSKTPRFRARKIERKRQRYTRANDLNILAARQFFKAQRSPYDGHVRSF
jgi:hypothetical protein